MAYTPTVWREHSMASGEKVTALNNLENLYTEAVNYIDAITHSERYYTEAQCGSKYFTSATDGTGSGLIAATLDGYTADQIIAAGTPSGNIAWWSGSEASIPSGWLLCNGLNGTPDLRNRFVPGAGSHYAKGDTGGANTVTTTGTITIGGHNLTADELPAHSHGSITDYYPYDAGYDIGGMGTTAGYLPAAITDTKRYTEYTGTGASHTHSATFAGTTDQDTRPPFYALCAIMKS